VTTAHKHKHKHKLKFTRIRQHLSQKYGLFYKGLFQYEHAKKRAHGRVRAPRSCLQASRGHGTVQHAHRTRTETHKRPGHSGF